MNNSAYLDNMAKVPALAKGEHFPVDEKAREDRRQVREAAKKAGLFDKCAHCGQVLPQ